jgi:hypothetical protein
MIRVLCDDLMFGKRWIQVWEASDFPVFHPFVLFIFLDDQLFWLFGNSREIYLRD